MLPSMWSPALETIGTSEVTQAGYSENAHSLRRDTKRACKSG